MQLKLYKTVDSDNVINKTLTDVVSITINLKKDVDILNPQLILSKIVGVDYSEYNYCELVELERFYFIRSIEILNNSVSKFVCECDYLETYKADIVASQALFKKRVEAGDYGEVDIASTGRDTITNIVSDVELVASNTILLSVMGVK